MELTNRVSSLRNGVIVFYSSRRQFRTSNIYAAPPSTDSPLNGSHQSLWKLYPRPTLFPLFFYNFYLGDYFIFVKRSQNIFLECSARLHGPMLAQMKTGQNKWAKPFSTNLQNYTRHFEGFRINQYRLNDFRN